MELRFEKGGGKVDRLTLRRADGSTATLDCPKQRIIPHDMVHYAVERELGARGFLGRVAAGEAAVLQMGAEAESDGVERLVEVIQGDAWSGGATPGADMIALYRVTCDARGCAPLAVDAETIDAIRAHMAELGRAWDAVPVGGTLTLELAAHA